MPSPWIRPRLGRVELQRRGGIRRTSAVMLAAVLGGVLAAPTAAQIPEEFTNLRHLDSEITRDSLLSVMRGFSFALGVRCQYCHVGGDGRSFEGVDFASDEDADKRKARYMLGMTSRINAELAALLPERDDPGVSMGCKNCHRGQSKPVLLSQELRFALDADGIDAAVTRYRSLRENSFSDGAFDFGEWEMNAFAEALSREERLPEAAAMYQLNQEFFPESRDIPGSLGRIFEQMGDTVQAIGAFERLLELVPGNARIEEHLKELRGGGTPD